MSVIISVLILRPGFFAFEESRLILLSWHLWFLFNSYIFIGATVEVLSGEDKMFKGLFFQDAMMKDACL